MPLPDDSRPLAVPIDDFVTPDDRALLSQYCPPTVIKVIENLCGLGYLAGYRAGVNAVAERISQHLKGGDDGGNQS